MSREELLGRLRRLLEEIVAIGDDELEQGVLDVVTDVLEAGGRRRRPTTLDVAEVGFCGMVGESPGMLEVYVLCRKLAAVQSPVLIRGESGTGKDLVARAIHRLGPRRSRPMVAENCAAIPETLLESVLFGHVRGAFTGAVRDHPGHFVAADGGSLFLDEIGDMPLPMQSKLLRVLQDGEVRPVGGNKTRRVDVRVLAATNQDLEGMVASGRFRQDLYYRLNVLEIVLPPLRERGHDVVLLARRFLEQAAAGRSPLRLSEAAEAALQRAKIPGNARQLQNEMQRLSALCDGPTIEVSALSKELGLSS